MITTKECCALQQNSTQRRSRQQRSRKRHSKQLHVQRPTWLVTFADMTTLLMVFFVMLLSMSSMDTLLLSQVHLSADNASLDLGADSAEAKQTVAAAALLVSGNAQIDEELFRLIFSESRLPPGLQIADLASLIHTEKRGEGIAIILTNALLFDAGSTRLNDRATQIITLLAPVMHSTGKDIVVKGYASPLTEGRKPLSPADRDELAAMRALAVLKQLEAGGADPTRLSISAVTPEGEGTEDVYGTQSLHRRVEIFIKPEKRSGTYYQL